MADSMVKLAEDHKEQLLNTNKSFKFVKELKKNKIYVFLALPGLLYFLVFKYIPMFGVMIAFKDVMPFDGIKEILVAPWVGFKHFESFVSSIFFWNILRNTITISLYMLLVGFPCPIIFALLLNEVRHVYFKRLVQTISYLPHFLSMVIVAGLVMNVLSPSSGIVNAVIQVLGGEPVYFLGSKDHFRGVLVGTSIWQGVGWGSIIYLAAISGISNELYEASIVDGAGRFKRLWHITLPGIMHIIVLMLILKMGDLLDAGFERVLLLYSPMVYDVADIIDTYVYRTGIGNMKYSFAAAVGVFKSVVSLIMICIANWGAKKMGQESLW